MVRWRVALELVSGWLDSELLADLRAGDYNFRAELPFRLALGDRSILRGTIDLLAHRAGGAPTIVDYKTDSIVGGIDHLDEAYELQRSLYAAAGRRGDPAPPRSAASTSSCSAPANR